MSLARADADAFERCIARGGVALFPTDTVYGLACDPGSPAALARLHELKGRPSDKPAAIMFFALERALAALPDLGPRTRDALTRLLPGAVTVLLSNPQGRYALACGANPGTLGLRVPALAAPIAALATVCAPVLQSSANPSGAADAYALHDVASSIRDGAGLVLDGGVLPGTPSTVLDLRRFEDGGGWSVVREGAVGRDALAGVLDVD